MHMKWLQELQYQRRTSVTTASCPINSKASLRLPNVAFRRSMNTMSLMAFTTTPAPKLTCGFPVRTNFRQLPGSSATFVTLFLAKSRTLSAWLKGHWSMEIVSPSETISGQRGPVRPHPAALSVAKFPHPAKGLRRSCAWLNCGVLETSRKRSAGKGHVHFGDQNRPLTGWNCWRKSDLANSTCVPQRSTCSIFDHSAITLALPTTFRLARSSCFNSVSFAKDFSSPDTAVFDKRRSSSSVALAKAARSPATSVPVRSSLRRSLALDKASNWPPTRVRRSSSHSNFVLFAKTSNEPDTLLSSRTRTCNAVSFEICGCSAPLSSASPGYSISVTRAQLSPPFHLGRCMHHHFLQPLLPAFGSLTTFEPMRRWCLWWAKTTLDEIQN